MKQKWRAAQVAALLFGLAALLAGCNNSFPDTSNYAGRTTASQASGATQAELVRAAAPYVAETTPGARGYKIGPLDVLDVTVFKVPDLSRSVQVAANGSINLPLIGDVPAAGKTPSALEKDLATKFNAGYLNGAQVTVFVKEYNSSRVTVDGAVKRPGVYPSRGHDTLMAAISLAEGLDREQASSDVIVFRADEDGVRSATRYDLGAIRSGKMADPAVQAGDVIVVEDSMLKSSFSQLAKVLPLASPLSYMLVAR